MPIDFEDPTLNYSFVERRAGDIISTYADTTKANSFLGWKLELT